MGLEAEIWALRLGFGPQGLDLGLEAGIWASRLGFRPQCWDLGIQAGILSSRLRFWPQGWDLGLQVGIWASRLGSGTPGWDLGRKAGILAWRLGFESRGGRMELRKEEKISHMCESLGHRPLRAPSTSTTTNLGRARVPLTISRICNYFDLNLYRSI